jgi:serine protease inhibitor
MKKKFLLVTMGVGMLVGACGSDGDEPTPKPDDNPQETEVTEQIPDEIPYTHIQLSESQKEMKDANNEFAFRLFKSVSENEDNTAFSPYSLFACLSMAANGDNGECRDLILNALGVGEGPEALAKLNSFNALMARMMPKADSRAFMLSANSVWINDGMRPYVNPSFISVVTGDCSAYVE